MAQNSIVIAGADGYLGRMAVKHFLSRGWQVVGTCLSETSREALGKFLADDAAITGGITSGLATLEVVDLANATAVENFAKGAGARSGYLLNAAGGFDFVSPFDATLPQYDFLMNANCKSAWLLIKYVVGAMRSRGFGRAVVISAAATRNAPGAGMGIYVASKTALNAIVEATADSLTGTNVRLNAICPTTLDTPRNRSDMPAAEFAKWVSIESVMASVERFFDESTNCANGAFLRLGAT